MVLESFTEIRGGAEEVVSSSSGSSRSSSGSGSGSGSSSIDYYCHGVGELHGDKRGRGGGGRGGGE